jgi:hypothetical protein
MGDTRICIVDEDGQCRAITKIVTYPDGFGVMSPYHAARRGWLYKHPVNYDQLTHGHMSLGECVEYNVNDQVKLSVHLGGFVQFSGIEAGRVISGVDPVTGQPRGIGLKGDPFSQTESGGPTFNLLAYGLHDFKLAGPSKRNLTFQQSDLYKGRWRGNPQTGYLVEGFLIPRRLARHVYGCAGAWKIKLELPYFSLVAFRHELEVVDLPGQPSFLGIIASRVTCDFPTASGFTLTGPAYCPPGGNYEGITATFPAPFEERPGVDLAYVPAS